MVPGHRGPAVHDLQRRLSAAGFLAPGSAEDSTFCARTHAAVLAFQQDYGMRPTGQVDEETWSALIEASWCLGERLLYVRTPHIRGDDVADLQSRLNRLGFDCGRVDGIFGPLAAGAVSDFQENLGLEANGICSPEVVEALERIGSQSGDGPGVAMVREANSLAEGHADNARLVIGHFPGCGALAHELERRCRAGHWLTSTVDSDAVSQARAANGFRADSYIGLESGPTVGFVAYFYEVPTFTSVGGRNLAHRLAAAVGSRIPELPAIAEGVRHPVLRETRMPAVLCVLGPPDVVALKTNALSNAILDAWESWLRDPLVEL